MFVSVLNWKVIKNGAVEKRESVSIFCIKGDPIRYFRKREITGRNVCNAIWWKRGEINVWGLRIIMRDSKE
jgi:hypothetical protein